MNPYKRALWCSIAIVVAILGVLFWLLPWWVATMVVTAYALGAHAGFSSGRAGQS